MNLQQIILTLEGLEEDILQGKKITCELLVKIIDGQIIVLDKISDDVEKNQKEFLLAIADISDADFPNLEKLKSLLEKFDLKTMVTTEQLILELIRILVAAFESGISEELIKDLKMKLLNIVSSDMNTK